jgi:hypothetical protein
MNNTFTNIVLVVILVLIVGFGVWYVSGREVPQAEDTSGIQLNIGGDAGPSEPTAP